MSYETKALLVLRSIDDTRPAQRLLVSAAASGTGLGAFNVFSIEHAEAFTSAADVATTPVVLQISQNAVR